MVRKAILPIILAALFIVPAFAQDAPTDISPWQTQVAADSALMTATADAPAPAPTPDPPVVVVQRSLLDELLPYAVIAAVSAIGFLTARQQGLSASAPYWQDALQRADSTRTTVDDALVRLAILLQGYTFEKHEDGSYTVTPPKDEKPPVA